MTPLEVLDTEFAGASDRAASIVAAAVLDDTLRELLEATLVSERPSGIDPFATGQELGSFMSRVKMAFLLGLIDDSERKRLALVAKIRNEFAHLAQDMSFKSPRVADRCRELSPPEELVPPRYVPGELELERLHEFKTPLANRDNPRALFEEATLLLLYVLKGRIAQAKFKHPFSPLPFKNAAEPAGEHLVHAMLAKRRAIESGQSPEEIAELTDMVTKLANIVVFAAAGANKRPATDSSGSAG